MHILLRYLFRDMLLKFRTIEQLQAVTVLYLALGYSSGLAAP